MSEVGLVGIAVGVVIGMLTGVLFTALMRTLRKDESLHTVLTAAAQLLGIAAVMSGGQWASGPMLQGLEPREVMSFYWPALSLTFVIIAIRGLFDFVFPGKPRSA